MPRCLPDTTWIVSPPKAWPEPPGWMTFSALTELEACPRRWALGAAEYAHLWDRPGYPSPINAAALEGKVVHLALEELSRAFAKRGVPSLRDESAIEAVKALGGYTKIISRWVERALGSVEGNPRCAPHMEQTRRNLQAHIPDMRARVQRLVSRARLAAGTRPVDASSESSQARNRLGEGSHAEVELRSTAMGWRGIADLITIEPQAIEIRDFKTGVPKESHQLQLRLYAWLWARDGDLNPNQRLVDRLVVSYDSHDTHIVSPSDSDLRSLEDEVQERTTRVLAAIRHHPPEARPSRENCAHCRVKHLCEEYWEYSAHKYGADSDFEEGFCDLQLNLASRHGPTSWDGVVTMSSVLGKGASVLLRVSKVPFELSVGQEVRALSVYLSPPVGTTTEDQSSPAVAIMSESSEVFVIRP